MKLSSVKTKPVQVSGSVPSKNVFKEIVTSLGKDNLLKLAQTVKDQGIITLPEYLKDKGYATVPTDIKESKEFLGILTQLPPNVVLSGQNQEYTIFDIIHKTNAGVSMSFAAPWLKDGTIQTDTTADNYLRSGPDTFVIGAVAAHGDRMKISNKEVICSYNLNIVQSEEVSRPTYQDGNIVVPGLTMFGSSSAVALSALKFDQKLFKEKMGGFARLPSGKWIEIGKATEYTDSEVINDIMFYSLKDKNITKHKIDRDMKAVFTKILKENTVQIQGISYRHSLLIDKDTTELVGRTLHWYVPIQRAMSPLNDRYPIEKPHNHSILRDAWCKKFPIRQMMRHGIAKGLKIQSEQLKASTPVVRAPTSSCKSMVVKALLDRGLAVRHPLHQLVDGISANDKKSAIRTNEIRGRLFELSDEGHTSAATLDITHVAATIKELNDGNVDIDAKNEKNVNIDVGMYCIFQATEPGDMDTLTKLAISEPELSNRLVFPIINSQTGEEYFSELGTVAETAAALQWTIYDLFNELLEEALEAEDKTAWFEQEVFDVDKSLEKTKLQKELRLLPYYILFRAMADKYNAILNNETVDIMKDKNDRDLALAGCEYGFVGRKVSKQFVCAFKSFNTKDSTPKAYLKNMDKHTMMPKLNKFIRVDGYNGRIGSPYNSTVYFWDAVSNSQTTGRSTFTFIVPIDKVRLETPAHVSSKLFNDDEEAMAAYNDKDIYYFLSRIDITNAKRNALVIRLLLEWEIRLGDTTEYVSINKENEDEY